MSDPKKILMLGDTHGYHEHVEWAASVAEANKADAIFVLGDFGYWEHADGGAFLDKCSAIVSDYGVPIYWLDGNHENHTWLRERYINKASVPRDDDGFVIMRKGLMHAPRAHTWTWRGKKFMALGGAYSIDIEGRLVGERRKRKQARAKIAALEMGQPVLITPSTIIEATEEHLYWWPEEEITDEEVEQALKVDKVDILLTHDKPLFASPDWNRKNDPTSMANQEKVQKVLEHLRPQTLFHGHLHYAYHDPMFIGADENDMIGVDIHGLDCNPELHGGDGWWWYTREQSIALVTLNGEIKVERETADDARQRDWNPRG